MQQSKDTYNFHIKGKDVAVQLKLSSEASYFEKYAMIALVYCRDVTNRITKEIEVYLRDTKVEIHSASQLFVIALLWMK